MRRALILSTALFAAAAASEAAMAQTQEQAQTRDQTSTTADGLRYLSWPGKTPTDRSAAHRSTPRPTPVARPLPLARIAAPVSASPRRGLTPAGDWLAAPAPAPTSAAPTSATPPAPTPAGAAQPAADPLAPRRDAPIFRLQAQGAAEPPTAEDAEAAQIQTAQASSAPVLGARFYSVHRQAGRKPDPIPPAQPVYLDALPLEMIQPPSSADLAQPDGPPALLRNSDGSVRAAPQTQEDALP